MLLREQYAVNNLILGMKCDGYGADNIFRCGIAPTWAPRIVIPPTDPTAGEPIRIMTTLHYCDTHRESFAVGEYLSGYEKARIERMARHARDDEFKPDFDHAFTEPVRIRTPEYREFLRAFLKAV